MLAALRHEPRGGAAGAYVPPSACRVPLGPRAPHHLPRVPNSSDGVRASSDGVSVRASRSRCSTVHVGRAARVLSTSTSSPATPAEHKDGGAAGADRLGRRGHRPDFDGLVRKWCASGLLPATLRPLAPP